MPLCSLCGDRTDGVHGAHCLDEHAQLLQSLGQALRTFVSLDQGPTIPIEVVSAPDGVQPDREAASPAAPPRRRLARALRVGVAAPFLLLTSAPIGGGPTPMGPRSVATPVKTAAVAARPPAPPEEPALGPSWPPTEKDWLDQIASDVWIHPLDGPTRRMPVSDSRVFGAERPGDRPGECSHGHCGVDIGGEVWGEPVHAAHDGVVDRVQRGPNEQHGGLYVRLSHREGRIFTQYFHLAAIPRHLKPGVAVRAGEVIGLLGESGVKFSDPHLHMTISVRPSSTLPERYIDPEPLIALWPLRADVPGLPGGMVIASSAPGTPRGAASSPRRTIAKAGRSPATTAE